MVNLNSGGKHIAASGSFALPFMTVDGFLNGSGLSLQLQDDPPGCTFSHKDTAVKRNSGFLASLVA